MKEMSFSNDHDYIQPMQSQLQKSVDRIKSNIRLRFHQNFFRRERQIMLNRQNSFHSKEKNFNSFQRTNMYQNQHEQPTPNQQQLQDKKYNICLNNKLQLFPIVQPQDQLIKSEAQGQLNSLKIPDLNNISTFTNLSNIANLYNFIRQGYYNQAPYIIITLIQRILQQIECRFITLNEIFCHINNKLVHIRSTMRNSYQENQNMAIMLLIIYKQIQNRFAAISNQSQHLIYRRKLMQICDKYKVLDIKMQGLFGVNTIKSIQY